MTADPKTAPTLSLAEEDSQASDGIETDDQSKSTSRMQRWLLRIRALLFVTVCATFGVLLVILPWTHQWTDNSLLLASPGLRAFISNGFVRGLATGLGMLDLWLGFWEAIHYHENPA